MMLKDKLSAFYAAVENVRCSVGDNAGKITEAIMADVFPDTYHASMQEGCDTMLRDGIYKAVTRYITKPKNDDRQSHMNDIDPEILPLVEPLGRVSYMVPSEKGSDKDDDTKTVGFYVPVADLIHDLIALEAACDFLDSKADQVQAEADKLRALLDHLKAAQ